MVSRTSRSLGVVRKAAHVLQDHSVSLACVRSFVLPLFEYCAPVSASACQSHLSLVDRVARCAESLCGGVGVGDLGHRRNVGLLSMLYKIYFNPTHPLRDSLPARFVPTRATRRAEALHNHAFVVPRCRTEQYMRTFLSCGLRLWNQLPLSVFCGSSVNRFLM